MIGQRVGPVPVGVCLHDVCIVGDCFVTKFQVIDLTKLAFILRVFNLNFVQSAGLSALTNLASYLSTLPDTTLT